MSCRRLFFCRLAYVQADDFAKTVTDVSLVKCDLSCHFSVCLVSKENAKIVMTRPVAQKFLDSCLSIEKFNSEDGATARIGCWPLDPERRSGGPILFCFRLASLNFVISQEGASVNLDLKALLSLQKFIKWHLPAYPTELHETGSPCLLNQCCVCNELSIQFASLSI